MGFKKNLQKLFSEPTEMRIDEIMNVLTHVGYILRSVKGSHYQFENKKSPRITFPCHNNKVKKIYLKTIKRTIIPLL